jgi:hypothetical protein
VVTESSHQTISASPTAEFPRLLIHRRAETEEMGLDRAERALTAKMGPPNNRAIGSGAQVISCS